MKAPTTQTMSFLEAQTRTSASLQASKLPSFQTSILKSKLMPYQYEWVMNWARFKIGLWSRQTGKSFATAAEAVLDCVRNPGSLWVILSAGERQAIEWMRKAKQWVAIFEVILESDEEIYPDKDAILTRTEITFANGSRIVAIPANPDTARGYSANLVLDEFAIHEKPWDIWAAIYPSITNPLSGEKKLRIVSTPKGMGNKFADLWHKNDHYSKQKVTIEDAVRMGLPVNLEELRNGVDDADIWAQEYMCEFIDSTAILLPYDLMAPCEVPTDEMDRIATDILDNPTDQTPLYVGMDVGRTKDLSVITLGAERNGLLYTLPPKILKKCPFHEQLEIITQIARRPNVRKVAIDKTGIGAMLAEEAERAVGNTIEGVTFTAKSKGEMYAGMRRRFEEKSLRIPADRDFREDLHAVQRNVSSTGTITYHAPRNADGHSDRASSLALMLYAAQNPYVSIAPTPIARTARRQTSGVAI